MPAVGVNDTFKKEYLQFILDQRRKGMYRFADPGNIAVVLVDEGNMLPGIRDVVQYAIDEINSKAGALGYRLSIQPNAPSTNFIKVTIGATGFSHGEDTQGNIITIGGISIPNVAQPSKQATLEEFLQTLGARSDPFIGNITYGLGPYIVTPDVNPRLNRTGIIFLGTLTQKEGVRFLP